MRKVVEVFKVKMMPAAKAAGKFVCEKRGAKYFCWQPFFHKEGEEKSFTTLINFFTSSGAFRL